MKIYISVIFSLFSIQSIAQSNPVALRSDVTVQRLMTVQLGVTRMTINPMTGRLFYMNLFNNIYEVHRINATTSIDSLRYTGADHGLSRPQGLAFFDSIMYVSGNINIDTAYTFGVIKKAVLQPDGSRVWSTIMETDPYALSGVGFENYDNQFSGMILSPNGDSITICSGARGDHGEVHTNKGLFPGKRNEPITANLFRVPTGSYTYIDNDSALIAASGFLFARGVRNMYSMAYDANNNLFGVDNSPERDQHEEMNWLRKGKHYGYPFRMGDSNNPQQYPSFNPASDVLINKYSDGWRKGTYYNDPTFPAAPPVTFEDPLQNSGPDADKFRDSITGKVKDASDLGVKIGTFSAHRTPLGLVFDKDNYLHNDFKGDGFMLSWNKGLDSCGCTTVPDTATGPFVDPSQDLLHLNLTYESGKDTYGLSATRVVKDFANPVDAVIDSNKIYVIEFGFTGTAGLYEITFRGTNTGVQKSATKAAISCFPNPAINELTFDFGGQSLIPVLNIYNSLGHLVQTNASSSPSASFTVPTSQLENGVYFYDLSSGNAHYSGKVVIIK